jgi:hypothetical protein
MFAGNELFVGERIDGWVRSAESRRCFAVATRTWSGGIRCDAELRMGKRKA